MAKQFTDEDEGGLQELAAHAAVALENTQQLEELLSKHQMLIEEAAGAGRAARIGAKGAVIALAVQLDQAEFFGADVQDRTGLGIILPGSGHGGDPIVIAMGHLDGGWGGGCGRDPFDAGQVELAQRPFQVIIDLAVVKTIGGFDTFAGRADLCHGNGGRTDIDA